MRLKPQRYVLAILMLALAGVLCWLTLYWVRIFIAPKEARTPPALSSATNVDSVADSITAAQLFGAPAAAPTVDTSQVSTLKIQLKGVFAGKESDPGYAIVNTGGAADEPVKVGAEVLPGAVLASVHPTHIVLNRAGILERVNLNEKGQAGGQPGDISSAGRGAQPKAPRAASGTAAPRKPVLQIPVPQVVNTAPAPSIPPESPAPPENTPRD